LWLNFSSNLSFSMGDSFSISGSGTFDMTGTATFENLNMGSGVSNNSAFNEIAGDSTLNIVPEPSRALLSLMGAAAIGLRRRRNSG
jgi:hypothetical protein